MLKKKKDKLQLYNWSPTARYRERVKSTQQTGNCAIITVHDIHVYPNKERLYLAKLQTSVDSTNMPSAPETLTSISANDCLIIQLITNIDTEISVKITVCNYFYTCPMFLFTTKEIVLRPLAVKMCFIKT